MRLPRATLLENIHTSAREELTSGSVDAEIRSGALDEDALIGLLTDAEGPALIGIRSKTHVTARVLEAAPGLEAIGAFCIGTDQIDLAAARKHGVAVFTAPFSSTRSVAELVVAEVVLLSRQIYARCKAAHEGRWLKSASGAKEVRGKVLGIVGYGHIGSQVSVLAEALGMTVLFHDIDKKLPLGNARPSVSLDDLLRTSDFVTLHVPDTPLTRSMIGAEQLDAMKEGSFLLNLSRGKVVDLEALRERLESGHIAGAAIDVYPTEPANTKEPFENLLRGLDNVVLTPHIGGSTLEAQANIGREVAAALVRWMHHGSTLGCVTLPQLEVPTPVGGHGTRIVNVHDNVPGVLSAVNHVVAESGANIVGQSLATNEDVGLLYIDVPVAHDAAAISELRNAIDDLETSIRTRTVAY